MKYTENYRLLKPDQEDYYNVDDFNDNAEIIDGKMKEALDAGSILEKVKSVDGDGSGLDADLVKGKDVYGLSLIHISATGLQFWAGIYMSF